MSIFKRFGLIHSLFGRDRDVRCYETGGDTWRLWLGDIIGWSEQEGGGRGGAQFGFHFNVGDLTGEFDESHQWPPVESPRSFLSRSVGFVVGRWGITLDWRGPQVDPETWDWPRWKLNKDGTVKEDWL